FLNPDGSVTNYSLTNTIIFQLSHSIGNSTFYTVGGSYFDKDFKSYAYEDPHDPRYTHPQLFRTVDSYSFFTGGTDLSRFHRSTKTLLGKVDLSSQIDDKNLVKVGVEFRRHKVFYESYNLIPVISQQAFNPFFSNPFITTEIPPISAGSEVQRGTYTRRPTEFSVYVQDKLEFSDFILNIGIRFDHFQPDGYVVNDESDPSIYSPIKTENSSKTLEERKAYWYRKATSKSKVSPRIGASFPVSDRGVVHFSYGHFFQVPRFERLYENPDFRLGSGTGNVGLVGNADLEPEQTINGEIGIQQQLTDDISVDLTAYLRDIRNLTTTGADEIIIFGGSAKYSKYQNRDFGTVKGIVLTATKRFSGGLSATLDYTYQVARGSGSDPQQSRNALLGGTLPEIQLTPLNWDQRHTLNVTGSYTGSNWGASLISQYGSGQPYTPRRSQDVSALLTNSQTKPEFFNMDARAYYEIPLDAFRIVTFIRVFNLLDTRNELNVFDDTGQADFTTDYQQAVSQNTSQLVNSIDDWFRRPGNYSEPRRIEFGVNLEF
ncbi:MAG: TonB-dependent receptor plug domain-containing protein, partial [Bacteroidota bacterium]